MLAGVGRTRNMGRSPWSVCADDLRKAIYDEKIRAGDAFKMKKSPGDNRGFSHFMNG